MTARRMWRGGLWLAAGMLLACTSGIDAARADETCNSPYIAKLIKGQEDYVYVWALGVEGVGDGADKLRDRGRRPEVEELRQGDRLRLGRLARRGASHGLHRRPALSSGRAAWPRARSTSFDIGDRSGQAQAREHHHRHGRQDRLSRAAHLLRAAGTDAGAGAVQREGQGRRHRDGALQQQGRVHHVATPCRPTAGATATATISRSTRRRTSCSRSSFTGYTNYMRPLGELVKDAEADEALRQHDGDVGPQGHEAEEDLQRARRALCMLRAGPAAKSGSTRAAGSSPAPTGENRLRIEGATQAKAWHRACQYPESTGMLGREFV